MLDQENNNDGILEIGNTSTFFDIAKYDYQLSLINQQYFFNAQKVKNDIEETSFCVVIPSYNNIQFITQTLNSVFWQNYHNWKMIYIDDASNDGTYQLVQIIKNLSGLSDDKFKLDLHDKRKRSAIYSFIEASQTFCQSNDVMIHLDGDDILASFNVMTKLNNLYKQKDIWLTYGQFIDSYGNIGAYCNQEISFEDWNNLRTIPWSTSHLRTSYTWLFRLINQEDLKRNDEFLRTSCDVALMLPMLEMAGKNRTRFVQDIMLVYRWHQSNDAALYTREQEETAQYIRKKPKYPLLPQSAAKL